MPLKRGLERRSCDFCFRRKIKCDRLLRAAQGFDKCSPCDVREERCLRTPRSDDRDNGRQGPRALSSEARGHRDNQDQRLTSFASTPDPWNAVLVENDSVASTQYTNGFFFNDDFALSNDSVLFLDQVFMGESFPTEWTDGISMTNVGEATSESAKNNIEDGHPGVTALNGINLPALGDDAQIITTALHAYFDYAASYLPILVADAFWTDLHAGRCSPSLVYAVASRGMPFTSAANKWELQQHFARTFREKFLEARAAVLDDGTVGLDDLEALALMLDFEYDDAGSPPLHANLGRLFLTHESLVLMMLRSQKHSYGKPHAQSSARLDRESERRVMLYWHVYGLDAFHCLDRKQQSLIPDIDATSDERTPPHQAKDYFDAILRLAVIARKITQALCSAAAKRKGVSPKDVRLMYEELALWRSHRCPQHLRRYKEDADILVAGRHNNTHNLSPLQQRNLQLRRTVLCALEINCTMQIEACVADSRLQVESDLEAEQTALQIDFESIRALNDMKEVCKWMRKFEAETCGTTHQQHSLVDLAPNILRNACAGLSFWACQRGINIWERQGGSHAFQAYARNERSKEEQVKMYKEIAQLLRDCVATAVSHKDTVQVLERVDCQRALLETLLERL
jgi:hypothetical protein